MRRVRTPRLRVLEGSVRLVFWCACLAKGARSALAAVAVIVDGAPILAALVSDVVGDVALARLAQRARAALAKGAMLWILAPVVAASNGAVRVVLAIAEGERAAGVIGRLLEEWRKGREEERQQRKWRRHLFIRESRFQRASQGCVREPYGRRVTSFSRKAISVA